MGGLSESCSGSAGIAGLTANMGLSSVASLCYQRTETALE